MNRNDRSIVGLAMAGHAMVHTYELSIPILVTVWLLEFPVTEATIGVVVSIGYALFGIGALPGGVLADRVGSRRLIVGCLFGMGVSFLLLSVAPSIPVIAFALLVWGIAASVYHPSGLSLISKGVTERGKGFAYHGMAGNFGIAVGPLLTALLLLAVDWRTAVGLLTIPAFLGGLAATRVDVDEAAAVEADGGSKAEAVSSWSEFLAGSRALFTGAFAGVFVIVIMSGLYYRGVLTFLPKILGEFPSFAPVSLGERALEPARYVYVGLLMVGMAGQYVGGRLTDRLRPEKGIAVAFAAMAVLALAFLPAANAGFVPFLVFGVALGFTLFLVQPMYQSTVAEYTPAGTRGLSYGYTYLGVFGIGALGGAIAGAILTYASRWALFGFLAAVAAVAATLAAAILRYDAA